MTSYAVMTENADIMNFLKNKMTTDVCKYMCDGFLDKNVIELGEYEVYNMLDKKKKYHNLNVIKRTKKFISYKIIPGECLMKKYYNNNSCDNPDIDFLCHYCKTRREDKTFRKKIFTDDNNIEYCKIDLDDSRSKDYYRIYANKK